MLFDKLLQPSCYICPFDAVERPLAQWLPVYGKVPLHGPVAARSQYALFGAEIAISRGPQGQIGSDDLSLLPLLTWVGAERHSCKQLAGGLAGILDGELAHIAKALAALLCCSNPILHDPSP